MKITLVDLHGSLVTSAKNLGWSVDAMKPWTDVKTIRPEPGMAFVSPANSLGFMDGGIDYVLSRIMFPGIEPRVKDAIMSRGHVTLLGRPYLPIGDAIAVPVPQSEYRGVYLISAPTMWLPQDVRGTHNAYHAMYAILKEASAVQEIREIVLCGLCTGCGMLSSDEAIRQMMDAFLDFNNGKTPRYSPKEISDEQPCVYMNTEFKIIPVEKLLTKE